MTDYSLALSDSAARRIKEYVRAWLSLFKAQAEFQKNLIAWAKGGPRPRGWTRTGPCLQIPECKLCGIRRRLLEVDDCFAKNPAEIARWHIAFLKTHLSGGDLHGTAYWCEYLAPRFSREVSEQKCARFVALYKRIAAYGYLAGSYPLVADFGAAPGLQSHFGFRYFRFDGSHRLACLHVLNVRQVPCLVFSVRSTSSQQVVTA
jgi:hypothetical protein